MFGADIFKSRRRLEAENLLLRHQLNIALRRAPPRLRLHGSDRALLVWGASLVHTRANDPSFRLWLIIRAWLSIRGAPATRESMDAIGQIEPFLSKTLVSRGQGPVCQFDGVGSALPVIVFLEHGVDLHRCTAFRRRVNISIADNRSARKADAAEYGSIRPSRTAWMLQNAPCTERCRCLPRSCR